MGTMLSWGGFPGTVVGDLEAPVHAENLSDATIRLTGKDGLLVGVDACLGTKQEVGTVMVRPGPLRPGLGVKKKLLPVGDLYIAGVVNVGGFMEYMVLQNTRLSLVMRMAQAIASGIIKADGMLRTVRAREKPEMVLREDAITLAAPGSAALQSPLLQEFARRR